VTSYKAFEWDESKNALNIAKHGVSFETASQKFEGPVYTAIDARFDYGERRFVSVGIVGNVVVLVVVHTDRDGHTRLISARTASRKERQKYYDEIQKS